MQTLDVSYKFVSNTLYHAWNEVTFDIHAVLYFYGIVCYQYMDSQPNTTSTLIIISECFFIRTIFCLVLI